MKTKTKLLALMEIAVVLCSLFLVAIPAIAADQNQTMQEVSASTTITTAASEDYYVLGIYGNANEDETIDMGDVVYTKLAIFGKKPKTELCDAKYDGRINVLDVIQTKLIILGKEKEITIVDAYEEVVTVRKPVKRIAIASIDKAETIRLLGAQDKIIGIDRSTKQKTTFFPEISKLPVVMTGGHAAPPDYEAILSLNADVFMPWAQTGWSMKKECEEKLPGVTIICLIKNHPAEPETFTGDVKKLGYILDKREEVEEFIEWYNEYIDKIKSRTEELSEDEKPRLFYTSWRGDYCILQCPICDLAGGRNIGADLVGGWAVKVDPEWVMVQNPDIIISKGSRGFGYAVDDPSEAIVQRDEILNRPEWANVNAVREGCVYFMVSASLDMEPAYLIGTAYLAKLFHPELFEDLDPEAIQQEYLTRFHHLDYDLDEHGIFVYLPIITGEGKLAGIPDRYYDSIIAQP